VHFLAGGAVLAGALVLASAPRAAASSTKQGAPARPFLSGLERISTLASTIPANGDENPYAVYVAPYSEGSIAAGDVLVDDFNAVSNEQGTGTTILLVTPSGAARTFATLPRDLSTCPGGVGLTTAMTELRDGWVLVGSVPTKSGTTTTAGHGCLVVLTASGAVAGAIAGTEVDGPWDMATVDNGSSVTILLTNTLIGVSHPGQKTVNAGDLVRLELSDTPSAAPRVVSSTVVATGFPERADFQSRLVAGPTGVVVESGTAYVADPLANTVVAVPDALSRTSSAGRGRVIASGGSLHGPLAMTEAPGGDLLVTNALNGDIVELTTAGRQVAHVDVDPDPAQSPPGDGDLFGLAVGLGDREIYFAKDDTNTLAALS
jgi:hypothetical protein